MTFIAREADKREDYKLWRILHDDDDNVIEDTSQGKDIMLNAE
mgnify:FL=1